MYSTSTDWMAAPRPAPTGTALFAIGDVHGMPGLLRAMYDLLRRAIADGEDGPVLLVTIGDYIDRGEAPLETLDLLREGVGLDGVDEIHLAGNHEQYLLEFLGFEEIDEDFMNDWLNNGGMATFAGMGIGAYRTFLRDPGLLPDEFRRKLGPQRLALLAGLEYRHRAGGYVFAHAGILPGTPLEEQDLADLLLVREPFLSAPAGWPHDFCVVHGHTISPPTVLPHRIAIDTGAFRTGMLTAVEIRDDRLRFHSVLDSSGNPHRDRLVGDLAALGYAEPEPVR